MKLFRYKLNTVADVDVMYTALKGPLGLVLTVKKHKSVKYTSTQVLTVLSMVAWMVVYQLFMMGIESACSKNCSPNGELTYMCIYKYGVWGMYNDC